jgi:hypothetical protein
VRVIVGVIVVLLGLTICSSCALRGQGPRLQRKLPKDWPIPQLTFSRDVKLNRVYSHGVKATSAEDQAEEMKWGALVYCNGGKDVMATEVATCLAPLGYQQVVVKAGEKDPVAELYQRFFSKDGLIEVSIFEDVSHGGTASLSGMLSEADKYKTGGSIDPASIKYLSVVIEVRTKSSHLYTSFAEGKGKCTLEPISR